MVLADGDVHLWHVPPGRAGRPELLAPDERARAAAIALDERRRRYTEVRASLRHLLQCYLRVPVITLAYGPHGKPELAQRGAGIVFSVSHGRGHAVIAVARGRALGVDLEHVVEGGGATLAVAERIFAARESAALRALPRAELGRRFTAVWTRKEAYVKALGTGLTLPLAAFEVSTTPGAPAVVRCAPCDLRPAAGWAMAES